MENKFYGVSLESVTKLDSLSEHIEEIKILGYTIVENVLNEEDLSKTSQLLDSIYAEQQRDFGVEQLKIINELNLARCPLAYDDIFLQVCTKPIIKELVKYFLGDYYIINQQNGIINFPNETHHQSSWHRDLPYQDYVVSKPIAVACLLCIDDFKQETGSTEVLPFSHNLDRIPSLNYINKHKVSTEVKKGGAIVFNAMLYHKAGYNQSSIIRRGLNTLFTIPLLKQQINLQSQLDGKYSDDAWTRRLLGYDSQVPESVTSWRSNRLNRLKK
jgi:ectoine hydroxylase-related dioxygenase (phytanoyl-CoA dioxygenase family)